MFCSTCGVQIDDNSLFCTKCGAKLHRIGKDDGDKPKISLEKPSDIKPEPEAEEIQAEEKTEETADGTITIPDNIPHISALPENHSEDVDRIKAVTENYKEPPKTVYADDIPEDDLPQPYYNEDDGYSRDDGYNYGEYIDGGQDYYNNGYDGIPQNDYYNPPPENIYPPETARPVKVGFFRLFGAGAVTLFAVVFLVVLSVLFCVKLGFSGDVLEKSFESVNIGTVLDSDTGFGNGETVNDYLYRETDFGGITAGFFGKEDFRDFILDLDINDFIAENLAVYADYLLGDGEKPNLESEEIADYMFARSDYGHLSKNDFRAMIANIGHGNTDTILSVDGWKRETGFDFGLCSYIFSFITLGVVLALVIVLMIWIAVITDKRGRYFTGFYRTAFVFSGVVCLAVGLAVIVAPPLLYSRTGNFLCYIGSKTLTDFGLFALATGGFEFVVGVIFGLVKKLAVRHEEKKYR